VLCQRTSQCSTSCPCTSLAPLSDHHTPAASCLTQPPTCTPGASTRHVLPMCRAQGPLSTTRFTSGHSAPSAPSSAESTKGRTAACSSLAVAPVTWTVRPTTAAGRSAGQARVVRRAAARAESTDGSLISSTCGRKHAAAQAMTGMVEYQPSPQVKEQKHEGGANTVQRQPRQRCYCTDLKMVLCGIPISHPSPSPPLPDSSTAARPHRSAAGWQ
jgi:hypothetical protein